MLDFSFTISNTVELIQHCVKLSFSVLYNRRSALLFIYLTVCFTKTFCANTLAEIQVIDLDTSLPTGAEIVCLLNSDESEHNPQRAGLSDVYCCALNVPSVSFGIKYQRVVGLEHLCV